MTIVAPLTNQSGAGTKMTSTPRSRCATPSRGWAVDGTPGDSVAFGLSEVFEGRAPDLVVSGTNFGPNVASLAPHSGTVGGAVAALEYGIPAIALSTGGLAAPDPVATVNAMGRTVDFAVKLIDQLRTRTRTGPLLPKGVGLTVNHPGCADPAAAAACLRAAPGTALVEAARTLPIPGPASGDGPLPLDPAAAVASGSWNKAPVLIGNARSEARLFVALTQPRLTPGSTPPRSWRHTGIRARRRSRATRCRRTASVPGHVGRADGLHVRLRDRTDSPAPRGARTRLRL
ncbi:5'/3'-nucleotidase SurE [Streptomyces sp. G-G2]|uniref:5'/3'-nucleotidase SurE n=1 Tax=Streptomyces sp. G-G2 TaxID=3046201 RepID=UPI0024B8E878|nr:5'/3'-nucleotidase SurE [Streptomyces sp. G-G2]MDJ0381993.1 5'/3'-nucleotidase SurE [Streptomyces sp. G-G2]